MLQGQKQRSLGGSNPSAATRIYKLSPAPLSRTCKTSGTLQLGSNASTGEGVDARALCHHAPAQNPPLQAPTNSSLVGRLSFSPTSARFDRDLMGVRSFAYAGLFPSPAQRLRALGFVAAVVGINSLAFSRFENCDLRTTKTAFIL